MMDIEYNRMKEKISMVERVEYKTALVNIVINEYDIEDAEKIYLH